MTNQEAEKINDLYKQLDALQVENTTLRDNHSDLTAKLVSIETKVDKLLDKGRLK